MTVKKVYEQYKHLDKLLTDKEWHPKSMLSKCTYDFWLAIRSEVMGRVPVLCGYTGGCGTRSNGRCDRDEQCEKFSAAPNSKEINRCPDVNTLIYQWTEQAQNPANSDAERNIYYLCAEQLHRQSQGV